MHVTALLLTLLPLALAGPLSSTSPPTATPSLQPRLCDKRCASEAPDNCGKGWYPWNFEGSVSLVHEAFEYGKTDRITAVLGMLQRSGTGGRILG